MILFPALAGLVLGGLVAVYLVAKGFVGLGGGLLAAVGVAGLGAGMGFVAWQLIGQVGRGLVAMVTATGANRSDPTFSLEASLVARGQYAEAADRLRAHLAQIPTDHAARLILASILSRHLRTPDEAAELYEVVRDTSPDQNQGFEAANALIDLHRSGGDRGKLLAALARFAHQYRGTPAADAAKRELSELKPREW